MMIVKSEVANKKKSRPPLFLREIQTLLAEVVIGVGQKPRSYYHVIVEQVLLFCYVVSSQSQYNMFFWLDSHLNLNIAHDHVSLCMSFLFAILFKDLGTATRPGRHVHVKIAANANAGVKKKRAASRERTGYPMNFP